MEDITAIILTKNEEKNILDCLKSIKGFCSRICVVDSFSEDNTVEIAHENGAEVYVHKFINYANQFNWAIDNTSIKSKWILRLDADERLTDELKTEISDELNKSKIDDINGYVFQARLFFMNKEIKHGGSQKRKLMLFKTGIGRIESREMDEHTILSHGKSISLKNKFIHYDYKSLDNFVNKLNSYATREVKDYFNSNFNQTDPLSDKSIMKTRKLKKIYYKFPIFLRSWLLFVYIYIIKLGFLDGKVGFIYHYMYYRWYRLLVDSKILEYLRSLNEVKK